MTKAYDMLGTEIFVGSYIVYATRYSTTMEQHVARVLEIGHNYIKVRTALTGWKKKWYARRGKVSYNAILRVTNTVVVLNTVPEWVKGVTE